MIEIVDLKKRFGSVWVTRGVNLTIQDQRMTVIIGRSGEGKSVLLKQIIGLIEPTSGHIIIDGTDIVHLDPYAMREVLQGFGYVFQFAALLDSLNVFENVGITLLERGVKRDHVLAIVKEKLSLVQLSADILWRQPAELSGGMRKRIGIARTLVTDPKIILYDEPTTGLDHWLDTFNSSNLNKIDLMTLYNIRRLTTISLPKKLSENTKKRAEQELKDLISKNNLAAFL